MISVCMATYNGANYIKEQLDSILSQLPLLSEIIIVDDNSSDNTVDIIQSFRDSRINIFRNNINLGVIKSFEQAIKLASGKYIFLSDQDDIWMPDKVNKTLYYFKNNKAILIVSDAYIMRDSRIELDTFYKFRNSNSGIARNLIKNSFIGCCMAFDSSVKHHILPISENISMHDVWIGVISSFYGKTLFIPERLIIYRRHENNYTQMTRSKLIKMMSRKSKDIYILSSKIFNSSRRFR